MKAICLTEKGDLATKKWGKLDCVELSMPKVEKDDDILIKVAYSSICGSDPLKLNGNMKVEPGAGFGHEMSGVIVDMGKGCNKRGLKVGDKVTGCFVHFCGVCENCRAGREQFCTEAVQNIVPTQAEYVLWSEDQVYKLPDDADLKTAALVEPLTIAMRSVDKADIRLGDRVAVSGGGGIGLMVVQLCKMAGASEVALLEPVEYKRNIGLALGADSAVDPMEEVFMERLKQIAPGGFDVVIECSGNGKAAETSIDIARNAGHVVFMSMYPTQYRLPLDLSTYLYHKELRLDGLFMATYYFDPAIRMLKRLNLDPIISKVYKLDECQQAYQDQISGQFAKLVFECS